MKRILFITTRNIVTTCGELRLIKNRAEVLYKDYGYVTDYLALVTKKDKSKRESMDFESSLAFYEFSITNPISFLKARNSFTREFKNRVQNNTYDIIILSGSIAFKYVKLVKKLAPQSRVFADVHGAAEELVEFKGKSVLKNIKAAVIYKLFKNSEKKNLPKFDDYFVVSSGLKNYLINEYKINGNAHIVPCASKDVDLNSEKIKIFRSASREKYGIKDNDILFIYSGGVSPWQCIEETVDIFKKIKQYDKENRCKLLILSGNLEYIEKFKDENILIDSLPADLVPSTLPCADFAFMLRDNYVTNNVAYPNKFLEYVSAGIKVIATPFVYDVAEQIREYDLGYLLSGVAFEEGLLDYCLNSTYTFASDFDNRKKLLEDVCFKNRLSFLK